MNTSPARPTQGRVWRIRRVGIIKFFPTIISQQEAPAQMKRAFTDDSLVIDNHLVSFWIFPMIFFFRRFRLLARELCISYNA